MFDVIKKSVLAGIGAFVITEEKVQATIDEFVEKGKISQKEGTCLVEELQKTIQENKEKFTSTIDERIQTILEELNLLTKDDLTELEKNMKKDIAKVDRRLAKIEKQLKEQGGQY